MCPGEQTATGGYTQGPVLVLSQSAEVSTFQSHLFPPAQPNSPRLPVPQFGDSRGEGLGVV